MVKVYKNLYKTLVGKSRGEMSKILGFNVDEFICDYNKKPGQSWKDQ